MATDTETNTPSAPPIPSRSRRMSRSLRRGGHAIGQLIGGYFGVTEESQTSYHGWSDVAQRRAEEGPVGFGTLGRRRSSTRDDNNPPPPDYNTLEMGERGLGQSFDIDELSSDSSGSDEDAFTNGPPEYNAISVPGRAGVEPARISMFGHEDPARAHRPQNISNLTTHEVTNGHASEEEDFITDPDRGARYYLNYIRAEKAVRQRRNLAAADEFFGGGRERSFSESQAMSATGRRGRLNSTAEAMARGRGRNKNARSKLERQNTLVREELQSLPTFWPIFIVGVTFVQVVAVVIFIVLHGLAKIDFEPVKHTANYPSLRNVSGNASVTYHTFTNLWIGTGLLDLIHSGVKFTPCMRKDVAIINRNLQQRNREEDSGGLGCCQNKVWVGTVIGEECVASDPNLNISNIDFEPVPCKDNNQFLANFHPCCISITGQCQVMHIRECTDRGGVFHSNKDSCNDTNCLDSICGFDGVGQENGDPARPVGTQIWRLILSLFIHLGVIHVVIVGTIQLYLGIKIERTAGFIRIALIYIISGVGGNLMSAIFIPYQVNGGASPAVFGLLSVVFVELFQFWQLIDRAWLEVVKLSSVFVFLLAFGTLPFIDNLANLGGFIFGIPSAIIFLPYITFGKVDAWRKRILLIVCVPLLILMFVVGLIVFYLVPDTDFCEGCHYFNCIPFTASFCQNEVSDPNPEIFAL